MHIDVLYYQNYPGFGIQNLHKAMQDFYHQPYRKMGTQGIHSYTAKSWPKQIRLMENLTVDLFVIFPAISRIKAEPV